MTKQVETLARSVLVAPEWDALVVPLLNALLDDVKEFAVSIESKGSEDVARGQAHAYQYLLNLRAILVAEDAQRKRFEAEGERREHDARRPDPRPKYTARVR